jgi:predicted nucleotidyltransferase
MLAMEASHEALRVVLNHHPYICLCILFGSTVSGKSNSGSDLDIAVASEQPLSAETRLALVEAFSSAVGREVDLVDLAADSGHILRQALSKGIVIKNTDRPLYARLISRMLFAEADMMPYHDRILRERRARFLNG